MGRWLLKGRETLQVEMQPTVEISRFPKYRQRMRHESREHRKDKQTSDRIGHSLGPRIERGGQYRNPVIGN